MGRSIIEVRNISKIYRLGAIGIGSLRDEFHQFLNRRKNNENSKNYFSALNNISFDVEQGEVIGLIGRNGAGKSTLLKILSRITEPTTGEIKLRGRIGSLLEVGTGFHPELSGRDNIYLNGAILGMTRSEISRKFDEIVAFSEVEKFIDTPVKRYSSGMYVRLAFAVAAHLEPEILIVDEVLAVGDQQFQKKCLGKMQDVSSREGKTVLIVSHTLPVILQLAHRCVVLECGSVKFIGSPEHAVEQYLDAGGEDSGVYFKVDEIPRKYIGTLDARIVALWFSRSIPIFGAHENFCFSLKIRTRHRTLVTRVSMTVFTIDGMPVGSCFSDEIVKLDNGVEFDVEVCLSNPRLAPGVYYCGVAIGKGSHRSKHVDYDIVIETLRFEVCAEPGQETAISNWCHQWGRINFGNLSLRKLEATPMNA